MVTVVSPKNPRLFATVEAVEAGIQVQFYHRARGSSTEAQAPALVLSNGLVTDAPFHVVLDHTYAVLNKEQVL